MHSDVDQFATSASASASAPPSLLQELSCYIHGGDNMTHTQFIPFQLPQYQHPAPADVYKQIKAENLEVQDQSAITMSATSASGEASFSSGTMGDGGREASNLQTSTATDSPQPIVKRKRNLPGTPDPDAEVIALSPKTLMATNRFVCEICNKGFQRDQNLQLHRRGHNLPWKLKQRTSKEIRKRVYICPEPSCVHHDPKRALGDLTGIKKHFCRKHGEKKWKCEKCSKRYAVQSDWKAHSKTCGTREYRCDCGTLFSRRDSFITHRAFCDALAEENAKSMAAGSGAQQAVSNQTITMGDLSSTHASMARLGGNSMDVSKLSFRENGFQLLPPRWEQPNTSNSCGTPGSTRPRLNLGLGTSAGPSPPTNEHLIGVPQHLQSSFLNTQEAQNGSPSELEGQKLAHSGLMPFGSGTSAIFGPGGVNLAGIIRPNFGQIGRIVDGMSGLIWTSDGGTMSLSENSSSSTNINSSAGPSVFNQSTAQMSATALLQKAAQMGATTRSPSLFRGLGMDSTASYGGLGSAWAGIATEHGGRGGTISNNFMHSFPPHMRNSAGLSNGGSFNPPNFGGMHEIMNSLSASAASNFPPLFGDMGSLEEMIQNRPADSQGDTIQPGLMKGPFNSSSMIPGHAKMMPKVEDPGANDRLTRDFLGVGGVSGMVGAPKSVLASLTQRDLAAITSSFGPAANMGPFGVNQKNE